MQQKIVNQISIIDPARLNFTDVSATWPRQEGNNLIISMTHLIINAGDKQPSAWYEEADLLFKDFSRITLKGYRQISPLEPLPGELKPPHVVTSEALETLDFVGSSSNARRGIYHLCSRENSFAIDQEGVQCLFVQEIIAETANIIVIPKARNRM